MGSLIDGIPDAVALQCLARAPLSQYPTLQLVSRAWRSAIQSPEVFRVRREAGTVEEWLYVNAREPDKIWQAYDPCCEKWFILPPMPSAVKHLANFGTAAVDGKLFVVGGGSDDVDPVTGDRDGVIATNEVWAFDAISRRWSRKAPMLTPRAQFACCVLDGSIVVAGGFTKTRKSMALAEKYNSQEDVWEPLPELGSVHNSACTGVVYEGKVHVVHKGVSKAQIYEPSEQRWVEFDCNWAQGNPAVVGHELFIVRHGTISREHRLPALRRSLRSWPDCLHRIGYAVTGLGSELYVVGGVMEPRGHSLDIEYMNDVDVCNVGSDKPVWRKGPRMTVSKGTVFGCAGLKL